MDNTRGEEMAAELVHEEKSVGAGGTSEEMSDNWVLFKSVRFLGVTIRFC
jgi:hypothetical protein